MGESKTVALRFRREGERERDGGKAGLLGYNGHGERERESVCENKRSS